MTVGLSAANLANKWLDMLGATAFTAPTCYAKLCIADPGPTGTAGGSASSVTTRVVMAWASASAGSKAIQATFPAWASWAGTNGEVVTHISVWDASTAGNFLYSFALTASKTVNTGDTLTLSSHSFALTPIAA